LARGVQANAGAQLKCTASWGRRTRPGLLERRRATRFFCCRVGAKAVTKQTPVGIFPSATRTYLRNGAATCKRSAGRALRATHRLIEERAETSQNTMRRHRLVPRMPGRVLASAQRPARHSSTAVADPSSTSACKMPHRSNVGSVDAYMARGGGFAVLDEPRSQRTSFSTNLVLNEPSYGSGPIGAFCLVF
jgi:hypothetical protein